MTKIVSTYLIGDLIDFPKQKISGSIRDRLMAFCDKIDNGNIDLASLKIPEGKRIYQMVYISEDLIVRVDKARLKLSQDLGKAISRSGFINLSIIHS